MNIGIVGLGLIGGTIAKTLNQHYTVSGYDISEATITYALEHKIIDRSYSDLKLFFEDNDIIFLCLYPNAILNFIFQNKHFIPKNRVIIEISGIKKYLISRVEELGDLPFDIIYTHPVAGREKAGIMHSDEKIFANANFVITPVDKNKKQNIDLVSDLAKKMGFQNISIVTPEQHDDIIAYTSQLTHVLSLSLVNAISTDLDTRRFIGDSYRDLTRISIINEKLWPQLFINNKEALIHKITEFESELRKIKDAIIMNDTEKLESLMRKSTQIRLSIDRGKNNES